MKTRFCLLALSLFFSLSGFGLELTIINNTQDTIIIKTLQTTETCGNLSIQYDIEVEPDNMQILQLSKYKCLEKLERFEETYIAFYNYSNRMNQAITIKCAGKSSANEVERRNDNYFSLDCSKENPVLHLDSVFM